MHIYAYNNGEGSKNLSEALGCKRIKHEGSKFVGGPGKVVINWGASQLPNWRAGTRIINKPEAVKTCSNKLDFFNRCAVAGGGRYPEWTQNPGIAKGWLAEGKVVCARQKLNGHSAEGLVIMESELDFVEAPLYTVYVPKKMEFRVHVFKGNDASFIVDIQRKIKKPDAEVKDWKIRNLDNGFIYARNGVEEIVPEDVRVQARRAFDLSGLDFGAVDVIFNEGQGRAYVLEINTAPGISGTTVENYAEAFRKLVA
jgi:hypothetical protein